MAESEKLITALWAIEHREAQYVEWMRFSQSQRNLKVRVNNYHGYVELSFHGSQWLSVEDFVSSYKSMSLTRLKEEWRRASKLFQQDELLEALHVTKNTTRTSVVRSSRVMTNESSDDTRRYFSSILDSLEPDSPSRRDVPHISNPFQQEEELQRRQQQRALESLKLRHQ